MAMKGIIALDIDGTSAERGKAVHPRLGLYLKKLSAQGWVIYFVTGRMLSFAKRAFTTLDFPFYLAVQNGADIIEYPSRKLLYRSYLPSDVSRKIDHQCSFVIYSGFETGDFCYYLPHFFSEKEHEYLNKLKAVADGKWVEISSLDDPAMQKEIPLIKGFGSFDQLQRVANQMTQYSASIIRDTIDESLYILLLTSKEADKGVAIDHLRQRLQMEASLPTIVAGDDRNDIAMFAKGDVRILIEGAPSEMRPLANLFALPPEKDGLIQALNTVIDEDGNYTKH